MNYKFPCVGDWRLRNMGIYKHTRSCRCLFENSKSSPLSPIQDEA
jgi:hypothetical protein